LHHALRCRRAQSIIVVISSSSFLSVSPAPRCSFMNSMLQCMSNTMELTDLFTDEPAYYGLVSGGPS